MQPMRDATEEAEAVDGSVLKDFIQEGHLSMSRSSRDSLRTTLLCHFGKPSHPAGADWVSSTGQPADDLRRCVGSIVV
jgi:hypothetical protein